MEFWFEFASTYSYLSVMRIEALAAEQNVPVTWQPFLLGPIFKTQGWDTSPFNLYPAKGHYMWRDMERQAEKFGLPFHRPSEFPRNGLLAARIALLGSEQPWGPAFVKAVYERNFVRNLAIDDAAALATVLVQLQLDAEAILEQAQSATNKQRLKEQTERAQTLGIFGAPSFVVGNELFWGNDRLEDALTHYRKTHRDAT